MCGITGLLHLDGRPVNTDILRAMSDSLSHRGPDDQAFGLFSLQAAQWRMAEKAQLRETSNDFPQANGAIGFNRLSIQDTSLRGRQPMSSPSGKTHIVFNGEMYNAPILRKELEKEGVNFRSRSDTEVVLHLFERHGYEYLLSRINGMFAFCIVDFVRRELFLARDHFGVKPFYYTLIDQTLLFSSESKSFLSCPQFTAELNCETLDEYLLFRSVNGPKTLLKNVLQLEPGQWMRIGCNGQQTGFYWKLPSREPNNGYGDDESEEFEARLRGSVLSQLISDVPLGCQLSGGIDSSVVTKFARDIVGSSLQAFSVIFANPTYSEEAWIDIATQKTGIQTHKFQLTGDWYAQHFEQATWHMDAPLNHANTLGILFLAKNARRWVKVLLSGEGADELLGGYNRFYYQQLGHQFPRWCSLLSHLPIVGRQVRRKLGSRFASEADRFILATARLNVEDARRLYPPFEIDAALESGRHRFRSISGASHLQQCLNYSMQTYLPEMLLRQDKMTMAASLENRVPFLDHELVEFVRQLPDRNLVRVSLMSGQSAERNTKTVLKKIAAKHFGREFAYRSKEGFAVPIRQFFSHAELQGLVCDRLLPGIASRGIFEMSEVHRLWKNVASLSVGELESLWVTLAFEMWAQLFLKTPAPMVA